MPHTTLRDHVLRHLLPSIQTPGQYVGGELNAVAKPANSVRGRLALAFPDTYAIGMSHHGLHLLYHLMNAREDWACERVFAPWPDMEAMLREHGLPLYGLESFTPLHEFDVVGFSLQYELSYTNVLTMLDLGGIPLRAEARGLADPLVIAGGPCVQNPEPMSRFVDLFVIGDGEESLPEVCDLWLESRVQGGSRREALSRMAARLPYAYVPALYEDRFEEGLASAPRPVHAAATEQVRPAVVPNLEAVPLPTRPILPNVECVQDRIAIEIMRGCPGKCRFCQSTTIKRPLRYRSVETIVAAALESYRTSGLNEISLLSLSTSDYPHFPELMRRMQEVFRPLGVSISVPSLRVTEQLQAVAEWMNTDRRSGLTLAPEVARDDMRVQIAKRVTNKDLYEGCRSALAKGFNRVKLYFMCGLPGERVEDLDGILEMAETISQLGREVRGRPATVVASVSNFVPKPQTPYQWNGMRTRDYFQWAHRHLYGKPRSRSVQVKCHDIDTSLLEAFTSRGDRRTGDVIEHAWRGGARFDAWTEHHRPDLWQQATDAAGLDRDEIVHAGRAVDRSLPWDHILIRQGRVYLEREQDRAMVQLPVG